MAQAPLISIITPSLNSKQYLPRLLACLDAQTYTNWEHIIVDSLSNDGTKEYLEPKISEKRKVIYAKDRCMYEAVNRGIAAARGEIVTYLNCDDLYFPKTLEIIAANFSNKPHIDIFFGDIISVQEESHSCILFAFHPRQYTLSRIGLNKYIGQPAVFMRKGVFETIGNFNEKMKYSGDLEFWVRASAKKMRFAKLNKFLSLDSRHAGNLRERDLPAANLETQNARLQYFNPNATLKKIYLWRNYWEDIYLNKLLEFFAEQRVTGPELIIHQALYRKKYRKQSTSEQGNILEINLPYFKFWADKIG